MGAVRGGQKRHSMGRPVGAPALAEPRASACTTCVHAGGYYPMDVQEGGRGLETHRSIPTVGHGCSTRSRRQPPSLSTMIVPPPAVSPAGRLCEC
eukprot:COSAG06_NODE_1200_length_10292_cov_59.321201_12_plen_95_part_00